MAALVRWFTLGLLFLYPDLTAMTSVTLHGVTDTLSGQNEKYASALETAAAAFREVEQLFNDPAYAQKSGWRIDEENDEGDVVYAKNTPKGKMVTISTELPIDVDSAMNETWIGVDDLPNWNPNINFARTVASPTPNFDIITYGNNDVLIVSGRDFVSARIYRNTPTGYIMASRSVRLKEVPEQKGKVRAELILAGARFYKHPEKDDATLVDVVMLADLKGLLPKFLVNQILGKIMLMDTEENRRHFQSIRDRKSQRNEQ
ncbi:hypothetical protein V3C99_005284 [Haemonchus contortus]|nr:Lipid-binding START domain containing protein [Haemonchus contortus]